MEQRFNTQPASYDEEDDPEYCFRGSQIEEEEDDHDFR
jgi:hypothetical protein